VRAANLEQLVSVGQGIFFRLYRLAEVYLRDHRSVVVNGSSIVLYTLIKELSAAGWKDARLALR
jgi:hypothetical protein